MFKVPRCLVRRQRSQRRFRIRKTDYGYRAAFRTGERRRLRWDKVVAVATYKRDLFAYDSICLSFLQETGETFEIDEESKQVWEEVTKQVRVYFPEIPEDWYAVVMCPAFASNWRELYRRPGHPALEQ